jgi:hypothetical protein
MLEEPAEKFDDGELGGAEACTAHCPVGEGDGTVLEAHDAAVGESDPEDIGGEGGEGGVAVVLGLARDVPGDRPDLRIDLLQQAGVTHVFFEERTGDASKRFDWDKEGGAGGAPGRAVLGEAPARDDVVDMGVILELSAPGMQDAGEPREVCPDEALVLGQALESHGRRLQQGLVRAALMGADAGSERLRDGAGEEEVRPGPLLVHVVVEPLVRCMLLTLRAMTIAAGMIDTVLAFTARALREAVAVMAALAISDSADGCAVRGGEGGGAFQIFWRKGVQDVAEGGHGRSPCRRVLRRS